MKKIFFRAGFCLLQRLNNCNLNKTFIWSNWMIRKISLITAMVFLTSCSSMFQPAVRDNGGMKLPENYTLYRADEPGPGNWWEAFGSEELNNLVAEALSGNFDIRSAFAKLKQADAEVRQAGAELKPELTAELGAEASRKQTKKEGASSVKSDSKTFTAGLTASYEIDLWGRLTSLRKSEILEYRAVREDLETAAVTVAAEVVSLWTDILAVRQRINILKEQIEMNRNLFSLQKYRFANGKATALDVAQQVETLAASEASLPMLQLTESKNMNALAVLLGRSGAERLKISQETLPTLISLPKTGLPADLLANRPDVRAAGLRLQSQDWQVSAARADRLPSLTLSAGATFSSDSVNLLFSNWIATLAASITGPIFDGGYRAAEVDRTRAVAEECLSEYARTVSEAVQEVEDCMSTETLQTEYLDLLEIQLNASRMTRKVARVQYMNGEDNYLDYLTARTNVQELERQQIDEQATLIKNRVELYRTLGGDWTRSLVGMDETRKKSNEGRTRQPG